MTYSKALAWLVVSWLLAACHSTKPETLGVYDGRLSPCPESPNCVSSQAATAEHQIEPLQVATPVEEGELMARLSKLVSNMERSRIIEKKNNYMHVEFRSAWFRFVDDLEFLLDAETGRIDLRSASRVGYSDFGVNRDRVERIRQSFTVAQ